MADLIRRFAASWRLELRLLCLHWTFPVLTAIWSGLVVFMYSTSIPTSAEAGLNGFFGPFAIGTLSLAALFVGAASASRSGRNRFLALEETFPTGAEVALGRWLACLTALLLPLVVPAALVWRAGPRASFVRGLPIFLLEAGLTFGFCAAVGWWLVSVLGGRRWVYPLLAAGWLGCLVVPVLANRRNLDVAGMQLLDFPRFESGRYDELWGRLLDGRLPLWFNLFYVGLALVFLGLLAWDHHRRRRRKMPVLASASVVAALALVVAAGYGYVAQVRDWDARAAASGPAGVAGAPGDAVPAGTATGPNAVDAWDIAADLSDPAAPRFDVRMTLRNAGDAPLPAVTLTLNRELSITESSLAYERHGDTLTLRLPAPLAPGETTEARLAYRGPLWQLVKDWYSIAEPLAFTARDGVRLPARAAWYPLPGKVDTQLRLLDAVHPRARVRLTVTAPDDLGVITNLPRRDAHTFAGDRASWLFLIASPRLRVEQVDGVTIAAPDVFLPRVRALAPRYADALDYFSRYFPDAHPDGLTLAVLDSGNDYIADTPPGGEQVLVVLDPVLARLLERDVVEAESGALMARDLGRDYVGNQVMIDLRYLSDQSPDALIGRSARFDALMGFLWLDYWAQGDPGKLAELVRDAPSSWLKTRQALYEVKQEQGEAGIVRVLQRLRAEEDADPGEDAREWTDAALAAWVTEAARAD